MMVSEFLPEVLGYVLVLFPVVLCVILALVIHSFSSRVIEIESNFKSIESLSLEDIDLIRPILNDYMKSLDLEHGPGYSLNSEYWPLMLKLHRIRYSLKPSDDEDR